MATAEARAKDYSGPDDGSGNGASGAPGDHAFVPACSTSAPTFDKPRNLPGWREKNFSPEDDPFTYMRHSTKGKALNHDVEDIYRHWDALVDRSELPALNEIVTDLVADTPRTERGLEQALLRDRPNPNAKPNAKPNPRP